MPSHLLHPEKIFRITKCSHAEARPNPALLLQRAVQTALLIVIAFAFVVFILIIGVSLDIHSGERQRSA
ncbi:hypothetical protein [Pseudomonas viridiflava]|uniref:hypothetical protein n=1 Tax=Pseudomonas viridiflava TaxID=33069 RepID=UPI002EC5D837|nr:hypothetical protein [Pseudomonas viridiflava]MEE3930149.1 hypothetical protein [Pseudomonas viridiflava]MEE3940379.1 hypothetical protein [Pseudomonas viridiflava]MEE3966386.1 hypothetical protein [Pseudomonas viridiflava]MEE3980506.1 hypothetical protein [Pseudomonas viridiflava]